MYHDIITHRRSLLSTRAKREIRIGFIFQVHLRRTRQASSSITKINGYAKFFTVAIYEENFVARQKISQNTLSFSILIQIIILYYIYFFF